MIRAGELRWKLTLVATVEAQNAAGEMISTPSAGASFWAKKLGLRADESGRTSGVQANAEAKFLARYRADLTANQRLTCDGEEWEITGVQEYGRREGLMIFARTTGRG
ncbi:MAG: phage head closure protein [Alphaproteobacteria bacterium]|nr:phage head closure protein [Alphaproteobacteria bacterium]